MSAIGAAERDMISEFVRAKGVKRYDEFDTGDRYYTLTWLQERGIKIEFAGRTRAKLRWRMNGKFLKAEEFDALVDRERAKAGLEPLLRNA